MDNLDQLLEYQEAAADRAAALLDLPQGEPIDLSSLTPGAEFRRRSDGEAVILSRLAGQVVHFALPARRRMDMCGAPAFLAAFEPLA